MPGWPSRAADLARASRPWVAVAIAGALALDEARVAAGAVPSRTVGPQLAFEADLAALRPALRAGDRVALLVWNDDPGPWYATQYALAPALVVPVRAAACLQEEVGPCGEGATHLLVRGLGRAEARLLGSLHGMVEVASTPERVLLAREPR